MCYSLLQLENFELKVVLNGLQAPMTAQAATVSESIIRLGGEGI